MTEFLWCYGAGAACAFMASDSLIIAALWPVFLVAWIKEEIAGSTR